MFSRFFIVFSAWILSFPGHAALMCVRLVVERDQVVSEFQRPAVNTVVSAGIPGNRTRMIPQTRFAEGAFDPENFLMYWNALLTYRGGNLYGQMLLRWADEIEKEIDATLADAFVLSVSNRISAPHDHSTRLFSPQPSLYEIYQISAALRSIQAVDTYPRERIHEATETEVRRGLEKLLIQLSGVISPYDYFRAQRADARIPVRFRSRSRAREMRPFLPINLHGMSNAARRIVPYLDTVALTADGEILGGAFCISQRLADQFIQDIRAVLLSR